MMKTPTYRLMKLRVSVCSELGIPVLSARAVNAIMRLRIKTREQLIVSIESGAISRALNVGIGTLNEIRVSVGFPPVEKVTRKTVFELWREAVELLSSPKTTQTKERIASFLKKSEEVYVLIQDSNKE